MELRTLNVEQQIAEADHNLKPYSVKVDQLTDHNLEAFVKKDFAGHAEYGYSGLVLRSTADKPKILIENEASFCTLLFATDANNKVLTIPRPAFIPDPGAVAADVFPRNVVGYINRAFHKSPRRALLITGTHEPEHTQSAIRDSVDKNFHNFERFYMFPDPKISQDVTLPSEKRYFFTGLVYIPSQLSTVSVPVLLVGRYEDMRETFRKKYPLITFDM